MRFLAVSLLAARSGRIFSKPNGVRGTLPLRISSSSSLSGIRSVNGTNRSTGTSTGRLLNRKTRFWNLAWTRRRRPNACMVSASRDWANRASIRASEKAGTLIPDWGWGLRLGPASVSRHQVQFRPVKTVSAFLHVLIFLFLETSRRQIVASRTVRFSGSYPRKHKHGFGMSSVNASTKSEIYVLPGSNNFNSVVASNLLPSQTAEPAL